MNHPPGQLEPVYPPMAWLDTVLKSEMSPESKLVALVLSQSSSYFRTSGYVMTNISPYSIGRIIKKTSPEVEEILLELCELGWIYDTGNRTGARRMYILTINKLPGRIRL